MIVQQRTNIDHDTPSYSFRAVLQPFTGDLQTTKYTNIINTQLIMLHKSMVGIMNRWMYEWMVELMAMSIAITMVICQHCSKIFF